MTRRQLRWTLAIVAVSVQVGLALWFYVLRPRLCRDRRGYC
jgi:hypothetical protein